MTTEQALNNLYAAARLAPFASRAAPKSSANPWKFYVEALKPKDEKKAE